MDIRFVFLLKTKRPIAVGVEIRREQEPFHRECFYVTGTWFTDQQSHHENKIKKSCE